MRRWIVIVGSLLSIRVVGAQSPTDSAQCRSLMSSVRDSITDTIGVSVAPVDRSVPVSGEYRRLLAQALAQTLSVPNPLPVGIYGGKRADIRARDPETIVPTVYGVYRMTVRRDGHATVWVDGGAHVAAFDQTVLTAVHTLSDSLMLPAFPMGFADPDSISLGLRIQQMDSWRYRSLADLIPLDMPYPLFVVRVPSFGSGQNATSTRGNRPPTYPALARARGIEGRVLLEFVVDATGVAEMSSVRVTQATIPEFAIAVLNALPSYRFQPLEVKGCHLATVVSMPFIFGLAGH